MYGALGSPLTPPRFQLATCSRCGEPVRRLEWLNEDETRSFRMVHDDGNPDCSTTSRGERYRVSAIEDAEAAPRLVICCLGCGCEETVGRGPRRAVSDRPGEGMKGT